MEFARGEEPRAGDVRRLVDGAAHIDRHHAADHSAHQDARRGIHAAEGRNQPLIDRRDGRGDDEKRDEPHDEDAEEGIEQNGLDAVERGG